MCYIVVAGQSLLQFKVRQTCYIVASFVHSLLVHCPAYLGAVSLPQIEVHKALSPSSSPSHLIRIVKKLLGKCSPELNLVHRL